MKGPQPLEAITGILGHSRNEVSYRDGALLKLGSIFRAELAAGCETERGKPQRPIIGSDQLFELARLQRLSSLVSSG